MRHPTTTVPRRNIPLLSALAILGVVLNHATWQVLGNIKPPALNGYAYMPLDQIGKLAIPAFMFIAGYFIAYATSGGRKPLPWAVVNARIRRLFWPWVFWSAIWLGGQALVNGARIHSMSVFEALFSQYYFIPMLMAYYLLAPLLVSVARRNLPALLGTATVLQLLTIGLFYLQVHAPNTLPGLLQRETWLDITLLRYLRFSIYFPFGLSVGMRPSAFTPLLRWRKALPWLTLLAYGLSALEGSLAYRSANPRWYAADSHIKLTSQLFSVGVLLCFMVYEHIPIPQRLGKTMRGMSANTYGIYLSHYVVVSVLDRVAGRLLPHPLPVWLGWAYVLLLTAGTLVVCVQMIQFSTRFKRIHQYLFG